MEQNNNIKPASETEGDDLAARLNEAFSAFKDLQERFLSEFQKRPNEILDEMPWWENERSKRCILIHDLLCAFQDGLRNGAYSVDAAEEWKGRLGCLMENEDRLYDLLSHKKKEIMDELETLTNAKYALKGYQKFGFGGQ
ncbi:MAG: hypothetical protein ACUVQ2_07385 [Dissulfurimicrobium sp.]|uniref:hypothetical protein n=1 Tax=Dissulfurimicrobium sp. TaxID=2022436 RepID=UPI00404936C9